LVSNPFAVNLFCCHCSWPVGGNDFNKEQQDVDKGIERNGMTLIFCAFLVMHALEPWRAT
jgi:hypothetical protein